MKALATGSLFVLIAVIGGINAVPFAFADHATAEVEIPEGTGVPGCDAEQTCYTPYEVTVDVGGEVTWNNADSAFHTVTAGVGPGDPQGIAADFPAETGVDFPNGFDSSIIQAGDTFSQKFDVAGTYPYYCTLHVWMTGIVNVEGTEDPGRPHTPVSGDTTPPKILLPVDLTADAENDAGARVVFDVLAIDDTDEIVRVSCTSGSGSVFPVGTTKVTCNASDRAGNAAKPVSFAVTVNPAKPSIPSWIKNVASFWCDGKIDDPAFVEGIQYLVDNDIIVAKAGVQSGGGSSDIPGWVKDNACWWSLDITSDEEFTSAIEFLIDKGIIRVG